MNMTAITTCYKDNTKNIEAKEPHAVKVAPPNVISMGHTIKSYTLPAKRLMTIMMIVGTMR